MKFDDFFERRVGGFGKYQYLVMLILGIEEVFIAFQVMGPVFMAATPKKYWCKHPQLFNDSVFGNCSLEDRLRLTVPPSDDITTGNEGLSHCDVYDVEFAAGSCDLAHIGSGNSTLTAEAVMLIRRAAENDTRPEVDKTRYDVRQCEDWVFDNSTFSSTIVTEWQFVCSTPRKGRAKSVSAIFLAGRAVGNSLFGWIADRFGRRPVFLIGGVMNVALGVASAFTPSYLPFLIFRFLQAVMATGKTNTGFILALEFSPSSKRVTVGTVYFAFWALGMCGLVGIAYLIRDWRYLLLAVSVPEIIVYIVFYFVFPESPRWLYTQGKIEEADKTIHNIGRVNGVELPKELNIDSTMEKNSASPMDLVRTPQLRHVTLIMLCVWAVCGVAYYAFNFSTGDLGGNLFLTTLASCALELPACLCVIPLFAYGGRIPTFSLFLLLTTVLVLASMTVMGDPSLHWPYLVLSLAGKFTVTVAFNMAWIYCGECYPTSIRSMGVTWTAIGARLSSPLGPFLVMLGVFWAYMPSVLIAVLTLGAGLGVLLLPETRGKPMVDTIEAGEAAIRANRLRPCRSVLGWYHVRLVPNKRRRKVLINGNGVTHAREEAVHLNGSAETQEKTQWGNGDLQI